MVGVPETVTTIAELRQRIAAERAAGRSIGFVPTMGALHAGHLSLVEEVRRRSDVSVVSIFVNPTQFGDPSDLEHYPRTFDTDVEQLAKLGVDLVFAPTVAEMYPDGSTQVTVTAGPVGQRFEGRSRPGHFDGMLTVVAKLLGIIAPDTAVFGEKDAQQLHLVRRMAADLNMPVEIVGAPTVREADGLALSSRNTRLDAAARQDALALSRALRAASAASEAGVEAALAAAQGVVQLDSGVALDYLAIVDPDTFLPVEDAHIGPARVIIAARVGDVRLIDNLLIAISGRR